MASHANIVITGASKGIGASLALCYAGPQVTLGLVGRDTRQLEEISAACRKKGALCVHASIDIREVEALALWLESFDDQYPVDLLIANAGIAATRGSGEAPELLCDLVAQADTNFRGTLVTAHIIIGRMLSRGRGQIALISSLNALFPASEAPTYSASKAGILAYGKALRRWLAPSGVRVSVVCPGFVKTNLAAGYDGPRPFEWTADDAARYIVRALKSARFFIAFPAPLVWAIRLSHFVPEILIAIVTRPYRAAIERSADSTPKR